MLRGTSLRGLSKMEVREFGELYRRTATDLAIARAETRDPKLINYLNSLVIRAHNKIYRAEGDGVSIIRQFFGRELPQAFRSTARFTVIAFIVFMATGVASFLLAYNDESFANLLGLDVYRTFATTNVQWWMDLNEANQIGASGILTNNIRVAFFAFALGAFFGIGTIYVLVLNGLMIGGVLGVCFRANPAFGTELVNFMVGHVVVELACIFIASGAGMSIGYALIDPGDLSRSQALKYRGREAAKVVIGCALFLFVAGVIEGFLSPATLPPGIKYATGILTGLLMMMYLVLAGRTTEESDAEAKWAAPNLAKN